MNNRQRVFISEYLKDFNATRSAKAAGYSLKTAYSYGQQLLKNLEVQEAIKAKIDELSMSAEEVRLRLADIARGDIADFIDNSGGELRLSLTAIDDEGKPITHPKSKLIRKIIQRTTRHVSPRGGETETTAVEIELYSAHDALRDIGKMHALFTENVEVKGPVTLVWTPHKPES